MPMNISSADTPLAVGADAARALQRQFESTRSFSLTLVQPLALEDRKEVAIPCADVAAAHRAKVHVADRVLGRLVHLQAACVRFRPA